MALGPPCSARAAPGRRAGGLRLRRRHRHSSARQFGVQDLIVKGTSVPALSGVFTPGEALALGPPCSARVARWTTAPVARDYDYDFVRERRPGSGPQRQYPPRPACLRVCWSAGMSTALWSQPARTDTLWARPRPRRARLRPSSTFSLPPTGTVAQSGALARSNRGPVLLCAVYWRSMYFVLSFNVLSTVLPSALAVRSSLRICTRTLAI